MHAASTPSGAGRSPVRGRQIDPVPLERATQWGLRGSLGHTGERLPGVDRLPKEHFAFRIVGVEAQALAIVPLCNVMLVHEVVRLGAQPERRQIGGLR